MQQHRLSYIKTKNRKTMFSRHTFLLAILFLTACNEPPQDTGIAWNLSFSPDGKNLLANGTFNAGTATRVYEMTHERTLVPIASLPTGAGGAAWSRDGSQIFFVNAEQSRIEIFDLQQRTVTAGCHCNFPPAGTLSPFSGDQIIVAPQLVADFQPSAEPPVMAHVLCPGGQPGTTEFGGCDTGTVFVVSTSNISGGPVAVSYAGGCPVEIWDYHDNNMQLRYHLPDLKQCWVKLSPDGQRLATLGAMGLSIWDLKQKGPERSVHFPEKRTSLTGFAEFSAFQNRLAFNQSGSRLALCFEDTVQVIDLSTQQVIFNRQFQYRDQVLSCTLSPDGNTVAWAGNRGMGFQLQAIGEEMNE